MYTIDATIFDIEHKGDRDSETERQKDVLTFLNSKANGVEFTLLTIPKITG